MARDCQSSNSNYLTRAPITTAAPFSLAMWVKSTSSTTDQFLFVIRDNSGNVDYWRVSFLGATGSGVIKFYVNQGGTLSTVNSTTFVANKWHRVTIVVASATDHRIYVDGGNKGQITASRVPAGVNEFTLMCHPGGSPLRGLMGPVTFWNNYALTDAEASDDADGTLVASQYRIDWNLDQRGSAVETDYSRTYPFTTNGTLLTDNSQSVPASIDILDQGLSEYSHNSRFSYGTTASIPTVGTKASIITWCNDQGTVVTAPPPPPPTPTTDRILWDDDRIFTKESADRTFASHDPGITMITASSVNNSRFKDISETNGLRDINGRPLLRKVNADPANEGVTRPWFELTISNNTERYNKTNQDDNSIRVGTGGSAYTTTIQPGVDWWHVIQFVLHDSLYADMGAPNNGDTSISGLHHYYYPNYPLTPFTLMADPPDSNGITIKWRVRRWNPPDVLNPTGTAQSTDHVVMSSAKAFKRYTIITHYRIGWLTSHNPIHEAWVQENGVWLNNGAPVYTYDGSISGSTGRAIGYNLNPYSHQTRTFAIYNWLCESKFDSPAYSGNTNASAWPDHVNNIPNTGDTGWKAWYRLGFTIKGTASTSGRVDVNKDTLAATANAATF